MVSFIFQLENQTQRPANDATEWFINRMGQGGDSTAIKGLSTQ